MTILKLTPEFSEKMQLECCFQENNDKKDKWKLKNAAQKSSLSWFIHKHSENTKRPSISLWFKFSLIFFSNITKSKP